MQSRRTKLTALKTFDTEELSKIREERLREIKMNAILREMATYLCFLVVLLFLCHQARHSNSYLMYNKLSQQFLENPIQAFGDVSVFVVIS